MQSKFCLNIFFCRQFSDSLPFGAFDPLYNYTNGSAKQFHNSLPAGSMAETKETFALVTGETRTYYDRR